MANALTKIQTNALADDAVTGAKIADDTVAEANMANDAISLAELKAGTDGQIITYDASGNPTAVGPGTDGQVLTSTGAGSPPAFEDVPAGGATINNATENELVTVASTTSQLDAESGLTYDGSDLNVTGNINPTGHLDMPDAKYIKLGTGDDLQIGHDTTNYINNWADLQIRNEASEVMIDCNRNGSVDLYHNNVKKIETTANGVDVTGYAKCTQGLIGQIGGGVIVAAASSASGSSGDSPNFKVDFTVPNGNAHDDYSDDIKDAFSSGETGYSANLNAGGSGILIATCLCSYYWGYATKIYHLTTYGDGSNHNSSLDQMHSYSHQGHPSGSPAVSLSVQSHNGKTPTIRATFGGDYWTANNLQVIYIGKGVASNRMLQASSMTGFHSSLTGQDTSWK